MDNFGSSVLLFVAIFSSTTLAVTEQVLSSVIYTRYGDRIPVNLPNPVLTPLGAQQLFAAGTSFRERYITEPISSSISNQSTALRGISPFLLENNEVNILTGSDQWLVASAQAFMQGFYPPLDTLSSDQNLDPQSTLANGSTINAPLNGYQYANIQSASSIDSNSIWVGGTGNCPAYTAAMMSYYGTTAFQTINAQTQDFYQGLRPDLLDGVFGEGAIGYWDAYYLNDYLEYAYTYNETAAKLLTPANLTKARILADDWTFAMYGNVSTPGGVGESDLRAIAGRTLAAWVYSSFLESIAKGGEDYKLNLLFGGYEPMISFAALTGLTSPQNVAFYNTPEAGSSFVFELVSFVADDDVVPYPDQASMFVRFFYQNGTGEDSSFIPYPLFSTSPEETLISWAEFAAEMQDIMINDVEDWCNVCGSVSVFCSAFANQFANSNNHKQGGLQPAVAGVIGALVTLVVAAIAFGALMLLGGFRLRRQERTRRLSGLAGFKGSKKLASDQDLTIPKGSAAATVAASHTDEPRGHERTGSWELREQAKQEEAQFGGIDKQIPSSNRRRPSFEDDDIRFDPYATPVKPHDTV